MGSQPPTMAVRTPRLALALVCLVLVNAQRQKPSERSQQQKQRKGKNAFWFKVDENQKELCNSVIEADQTVFNVPPADQCKSDEERFCFCGKKGEKQTPNWKYLCGECRENKPFSFKVESAGDKQRKGMMGRHPRCSDEELPKCEDGSRPQKPEERGQPPKCADGGFPLCSDGNPPSR